MRPYEKSREIIDPKDKKKTDDDNSMDEAMNKSVTPPQNTTGVPTDVNASSKTTGDGVDVQEEQLKLDGTNPTVKPQDTPVVIENKEKEAPFESSTISTSELDSDNSDDESDDSLEDDIEEKNKDKKKNDDIIEGTDVQEGEEDEKTYDTAKAIKSQIEKMDGDKMDVLQNVMVTNYKRNKAAGIFGEEGNEVSDDVLAAKGITAPDKDAPTGVLPIGPKKDGLLGKAKKLAKPAFSKTMTGLSVVSDLAMAGSAATNLGLSIQEFKAEKNNSEIRPVLDENGKPKFNEKGEPELTSDRKEMMDAHSGYRKMSAGLAMGSQAINMLQSGLGIAKSVKGTRSKNKRKKKAAYRGIATSALAMLTNASNMVSTGISGFGDPTNIASQKKTSDAFTAISTISNFISAGINLTGAIFDRSSRKDVMKDTAALAVTDDANDTEQKRKKQEMNDTEGKSAYENRLSAEKYNAYKAKKYAMQQASDFNRLKRHNRIKGVAGALGSGVTAANNIMKLTAGNFAKSAGGMLTSGILGAVGYGLGMAEKYGGKINDKILDKKADSKKKKVIKSYLEKKRQTVREQAENAFKGHPEGYGKNLSDNLVDRITIGRLGINVKLSNEDISNDLLLKGFDKLNLKRANNIMKSGEAKGEMLAALGLEEDASVEEIAAALTGD